MPAEKAILSETPLVALYGDVCVVVPGAVAGVEDIFKIRTGIFEAIKRRSAGLALLFIIAEKAAPPTGQARDAAAQMFEDFAARVVGLGVVLEGSGFAAATKRGVITWLVKPLVGKTPLKTFSGMVEASEWLELRSKEKKLTCPTAEELRRHVRELRGQPA
jgi:hypothetical protein